MSLADKIEKKSRNTRLKSRAKSKRRSGRQKMPCNAAELTRPATIVVCKHDGTLLIPAIHFNNVVGVKGAASFAKDRYKIEEWKGEGDLSNAFYAVDKKSHQPLVIKIIKSQMLGEFRRVRKFADMLQRNDRIAASEHCDSAGLWNRQRIGNVDATSLCCG